MLAMFFRRKETIVKMALNTFVQLGMIEIIDDMLYLTNFEKVSKYRWV